MRQKRDYSSPLPSFPKGEGRNNRRGKEGWKGAEELRDDRQAEGIYGDAYGVGNYVLMGRLRHRLKGNEWPWLRGVPCKKRGGYRRRNTRERSSKRRKLHLSSFTSHQCWGGVYAATDQGECTLCTLKENFVACNMTATTALHGMNRNMRVNKTMVLN